jgi:large subunit ribosomal protein L10
LSLNRSEKEAVISEVTSLAAKAQTLVMAEYRGITVADMTNLRIKARSQHPGPSRCGWYRFRSGC